MSPCYPQRLPSNRHRLPTNRRCRAYWTLRVFFFLFHYGTPCPTPSPCHTHIPCRLDTCRLLPNPDLLCLLPPPLCTGCASPRSTGAGPGSTGARPRPIGAPPVVAFLALQRCQCTRGTTMHSICQHVPLHPPNSCHAAHGPLQCVGVLQEPHRPLPRSDPASPCVCSSLAFHPWSPPHCHPFVNPEGGGRRSHPTRTTERLIGSAAVKDDHNESRAQKSVARQPPAFARIGSRCAPTGGGGGGGSWWGFRPGSVSFQLGPSTHRTSTRVPLRSPHGSGLPALSRRLSTGSDTPFGDGTARCPCLPQACWGGWGLESEVGAAHCHPRSLRVQLVPCLGRGWFARPPSERIA